MDARHLLEREGPRGRGRKEEREQEGGEGRKECDRVRGRGERNMRVGEPRQGCTPTGWMLLLGFLSTKREAGRGTRATRIPLSEIDNREIRICLTNRNDLIRISRGS